MTIHVLPLPRRNPRQEDETPVDGIAGGPSPSTVAAAIREGTFSTDRTFDRFLPTDLREASGQHWTPLAVAARVAAWFRELNVRSVVDIGSGAGKFCVATALAGRASFTGLEQRLRLVEASRSLARWFQVEDRVRFVHGALGDVAVPIADAYYLYNPFGENIIGFDDRLDDEVELSDDRYRRDIDLAEDLLRQLPGGSVVVTYNGFGGHMPGGYQQLRVDRELPNVLRVWRKGHLAPRRKARGTIALRSE